MERKNTVSITQKGRKVLKSFIGRVEVTKEYITAEEFFRSRMEKVGDNKESRKRYEEFQRAVEEVGKKLNELATEGAGFQLMFNDLTEESVLIISTSTREIMISSCVTSWGGGHNLKIDELVQICRLGK